MSTQAPILATRDLGLDIGGARIVADVSLEVRAGELVGIIGPNGAGKTTLFNLLSGTVRPTTGSVELDGKDVTRDPPHRRTQAGLGRSFQVSSVFPLLSVGENVRLAAEAKLGGTLNVVRRAARYRPALERAGDALGKVGLASRTAWPAGMLSHGDKRKLELAMLLAGDPRVILLDEPMAGVSVEDVDGLVEVIRSVHGDEGRTVLMVEHRMEVVIGLAEKIAVMPVAIGWSDLGSWEALLDRLPRDEGGNAIAGDVLALGTRNCLIRSEGPLVTAIGIEDLIVIATGDAILIVPKAQSQKVKDAVEALKEQGRDAWI